MVVFTFSLFALTKEQVAEIALQNTPTKIVESDAFLRVHGEQYSFEIADPLKMINMHQLSYLEFQNEGDNSKYLLVAWNYGSDIYLRLFRSSDAVNYVLFQDFPQTYAWGGASDSTPYICFRQEKLTNSVNPEILLSNGIRDMSTLVVFQWRNGKLVDIAQEDKFIGNSTIIPKFCTSMEMEVVLQDLDDDNKAEIIVYPYGKREPVFADPNKPNLTDNDIVDWDWVFDGPLKIYKYDGSLYVLWQELPFSFDDPYPITVPAIGAFHPSTIPLTELNNPGNGKIKIFVSHPAGNYTVDDIDTSKFAYKGSTINFKKKWNNNKYPDATSANSEWYGCPVRQANRQGQGEWQINPSDPAIPAPDGEMEYHYVGSYLELELSRTLIYPGLLTEAQQFFAKGTDKQYYYGIIQSSGKMKNGKLLSVSAFICIKKTGTAEAKAAADAKKAGSAASEKK